MNLCRYILCSFITLFGATFSCFSVALPTDSKEEIVILSNSAEIDRKKGTVMYRGDVTLTQGTLKIQSDIITLTQENDQLKNLVAEGKPARYQQQFGEERQLTIANGDRITYDALAETITISGNAQLSQNDNLFSGGRIIYDIQAETVTADSGQMQTTDTATGEAADPQRIRVVIQPPARDESKPDLSNDTNAEKDL